MQPVDLQLNTKHFNTDKSKTNHQKEIDCVLYAVNNDLMHKEPLLLKKEAFQFTSWQLTARQICDIELLLNCAFTPLTGFLCEKAYNFVLNDMRLSDGTLWPMPITLDISEAFASSLSIDVKITLRDHEGFALPHHYDYQSDRHTPSELKTIFKEKGWKKIVAFQ